LWFNVLGSTSEASLKNCWGPFAGQATVLLRLLMVTALVTACQLTGEARLEVVWTSMVTLPVGHER